MIKIAHFTSALTGGAGVAAQRLHVALRGQGCSTRLCFGSGVASNADCQQAHHNSSFFWRNVAALTLSWQNRRREQAQGFFTYSKWIRATPLASFGPLPEVVNLHWIAHWLDQPSFFASLPPGLPVVWSLHDLNPVTGGCHHPLDCERYHQHCQSCPKLKHPGPRDDSFRNFQLKDRLFAGLNLHFVGNSEWTTAQAGQSALMRHAKSSQTIPLGIDVRQFVPVDKAVARQALGLANGRLFVGFACADFSYRTKGGATLLEALNGLAEKSPITLLAFGAGKLPSANAHLQVIELGSLNSPRLQSLFYSALDVFAVPSRIESFGLTAVEAMACGTPVLAFKTGGLAEVVADGETGVLEPDIGSAPGLSRHIEWFISHSQERQTMGQAARTRVEKLFNSELMARRYLRLYGTLVTDETLG